jgi:hypothetical protein
MWNLESQKLGEAKACPRCAKRAKTADGSFGAVSILCLVLIRGKML